LVANKKRECLLRDLSIALDTAQSEREPIEATIVEEPGRRVIAAERARAGRAFPWVDAAAFARRALDMARRDRIWAMRATAKGFIFFDRGLVDAAAALEHATGRPELNTVAGERYNTRVFLTPPWPEIYVQDADRQHDFEEAVAEYERLLAAFSALDYAIEVLPKVGISERADFVLERLRRLS
jgi:predicted ATPase